MKLKRYLPLLLLLTIQLFGAILIFRPDFYVAQDGSNQVARIGAYYKAFSEINIPPRWAGDLNFGYGTPVFNFFYPLPGYIGSFFHALGFSLEDSFKLIAGIAFLLSPLTFYFWIRKKFSGSASFVASLFYGLAPYHFLDLYVRGDLGETLGFVFIPLVLLFIDEIIENPSAKKIILGGISFGLFILSHNGLALIFTPVFLFYAAIFSKRKIKFINVVIMFAIGFGMSAFFWLPALYESKYTNFYFFNNDLFKSNFPGIPQLIYSKWGFGPDIKITGGLSPQIGPLHLLFVLISFLMYLKFRKSQVLFWLLVFVGALFLSTSYSLQVWEIVKPLRQLEFPWRFTALSSSAAAVLAGFVLTKLNNKFLDVAAAVLLILLSLPFIKIDRSISFSDQYYLSFSGTTTYHSEVATIWAGGDASSYPKKPVEVIAGDAKISQYVRRNGIHKIFTESKLPSRILDNTLYFPGWRVKIDGKNVPIEFQDPNHKGLVTFSVPAGLHNTVVEFQETPVRLLADILSLVTLIMISPELLVPGLVSKLWQKKLS